MSQAGVLAALGSSYHLVWLELTPQEQGDEVAQGNRLSDAINAALGEPLLGYGLPYHYALQFIGSHLSLLSPLAFVVLHAGRDATFAQDLLALNHKGHRVLLAFKRLPEDFAVPADALVLRAAEVGPDAAEVEGEGGAVPEPLGSTRAEEALSFQADVDTRLTFLKEQGRWTEALEAALEHCPAAVPEVLSEAGHVFHERGLHARLRTLLEALPEPFRQGEVVLYWRLTAASRVAGAAEALRAEVETHLAANEAPELRALYAGALLPPEKLVAEAERAYRARATPFTLFQYGRSLVAQPLKSLELLREAVNVAEGEGRPYDVARNAGLYASRLIFAGRYREAVHWGGWALTHFHRHGLGDEQRRLLLVNDLAYARLLTGQTAGLKAELEATERHLAEVIPDLARLFRTTLGDYQLVAGQREAALDTYAHNLERVPRRHLGTAILGVVRALMDLGRGADALAEAERVLALTRDEPAPYYAPAEFAHALARSQVTPREATSWLERYLEHETTRLHRKAQAALHLARAHLVLGDPGRARQAVQRAAAGFAELAPSGFRLFAGPETAFRETFRLYLGGPRLEARFLGRAELWFDDVPLALTPRELEVVTLLLLEPSGLSLDCLGLKLSRDSVNRRSLISGVNKLRGKLPLSSEPYCLEVAAEADFLRLQRALEHGAIREALELYLGPLLHDSDAPGIVEAREQLEEALRQVVLASDDAEAILALARRLEGDLELWERALATLPPGDFRRPLARAQVLRLRASWDGDLT